MASAVPDIKLLAVLGVRSAPYERDLWMGPVRWTVNGASGMKLLPSALVCVRCSFFRACGVCVLVRECKTCARSYTCAAAHGCAHAAGCTFAIARGSTFVFVCMGAVAGLQLCTGPEVRHDKLGGALGAVLELQWRPEEMQSG